MQNNIYSLTEKILNRIINNGNKHNSEITVLKNTISELEIKLNTILATLDINKYKKVCPRCKGKGSVTFNDYAGITRHEPCPYCFGKCNI